MPRGGTPILPRDHVFIAMRSKLKPLITCLFDPCPASQKLSPGLKLDFPADSTVAQVHLFFGMPEPVNNQGKRSIGSLITEEETDQSTRLGPFLVTPGDQPDLMTFTYAPDQNHQNSGVNRQSPLREGAGPEEA